MERKLKIAFLLNTPLDYNIRAAKTIRSLLVHYEVLVFCNGKSSVPFILEDRTFRLVDVSPCIHSNILNTHFLIGNQFKSSLQFIIKELNEVRPDIIYAADLTTLSSGVSLKKYYSAKLVYDSYEIYVETINQYYPLERGGYKKILYKGVIATSRMINNIREAIYFKSVDLFITTCDSYLKYFLSKYEIKKYAILRNTPPHTSYESIDLIDLHTEFRILKEKKIVLYIGTFNSGRSLDKLVLSGKYLSEDYFILFLGFGPLKEYLQELVLQNSLSTKVGIFGPYRMEDTLRYCKSADLGILLIDNTNLSKYYASANKVFDFMMTKVPMLLSKAPENEKLIKEVGCGKIIANLSPKEIAKDITEVLTNPMLENMGEKGLAYSIKDGNWNVDELVLLNELRNLYD